MDQTSHFVQLNLSSSTSNGNTVFSVKLIAKVGSGAWSGTLSLQSSPNGTTWTTQGADITSIGNNNASVTPSRNLPANTRFVRVFYTTKDSGSNVGVDDVSLVGGTLPVTLLSFTAKADNNSARLDWATATEQNSSHFLIQRSVDGGRSFATIGQVAGQGDSNGRVDYTFVDDKPASGTNYYRLHQFDYDGANEYFGPVSVTFSGKEAEAVRVWPSLVAQELTIATSGDSEAALQLSIYDLNGRLLLQKTLSEKTLQTTWSVAELPAGTYFMQWQQGAAHGQARFVKM